MKTIRATKTYIFLILLLAFSSIGICQSQVNIKHNDPKKQILKLHHNAVLLVRLKTKEKSIIACRNTGQPELAEKIETKQKEINLRIVDGFNKNYNFSEVYFFFSDQSQNIQNREIDSIIFLNSQLQEDKSIRPELLNFYIAEFGVVSSETGLQGLMIKDDNFELLERPFPYYSKTPFFSSRSKSESKTIKRLNNKLHNYYNFHY